MRAGTASKAASDIVAVVAMALLLLYLADDAIANSPGNESRMGFLPMDAAQRGIILGMSSAALFLVAFGINFKGNSMTTAVLLIVGGALRGAIMLGIILMTGGFAAFSPTFHAGMLLGFIIMGLGVWQAVRIRRASAIAVKR